MSELFDTKQRFVSDLTATLPDYRRKVEVIYNPDETGEAQLEDSLRNWGEIDEMVEKIVDPREMSKNMDHGDAYYGEDEEEEVYTIRVRPPMDQLARNWVVCESFVALDEVHHAYSLASVIISKH
ncbi:hypothetical protein PRIPAC_74489 [Pristionchus pacificus]|nr:hypothetical protein PRIPAC_74489 [Pristionchus pacificus]